MIDTCVMHAAISQSIRTFQLTRKKVDTYVEALAKAGAIHVRLDQQRGLEDEYERTSNRELVKESVRTLQNLGSVSRVQPVGAIPQPARKRLRQAGLVGTIDLLCVRIALSEAPTPSLIASRDCDFWDPGDTKSVGRTGAPVCRILREFLAVEVATEEALRSLHPGATT